MNIRLQISLPYEVALSLKELANQEKRDPRRQVVMMIEQNLQRRGLLAAGPKLSDISNLAARLIPYDTLDEGIDLKWTKPISRQSLY